MVNSYSFIIPLFVLLVACNMLPCASLAKELIEKPQMSRLKRGAWIYFYKPIGNSNTVTPAEMNNRGSRVLGGMQDLSPSGSQTIPVTAKPPKMTPSPTNPPVFVTTRPPTQISPNTCQLRCTNPYHRSGCTVNIQQCRCPNRNRQLCANDGVTYLNGCWLQCARTYCNTGLQVYFEGVCAVRYNPYG